MVALEAPSAYIGGVSMFYCAAEHFFVEALNLHGTKVVSFQLALEIHRWYIAGCYLTPGNASTI